MDSNITDLKERMNHFIIRDKAISKKLGEAWEILYECSNSIRVMLEEEDFEDAVSASKDDGDLVELLELYKRTRRHLDYIYYDDLSKAVHHADYCT